MVFRGRNGAEITRIFESPSRSCKAQICLQAILRSQMRLHLKPAAPLAGVVISAKGRVTDFFRSLLPTREIEYCSVRLKLKTIFLRSVF